MTAERFRLKSAVHVFMLRGDEVLLLRRYNTGYEDGRYSVPAGHLDGGETVVAAAIREVQEEVGVALNPAEVDVAGVMHRRAEDERVDWFVAARSWRGEPENREPHRCDELRWSPLDAPPPETIPYVRRALDNFRAGRWFDSFGWPDDMP
jgi:8-oxo-dGTP diphosphatase